MRWNEQGFITNFLICGPMETPFTDTTGRRDSNQLRYEAYLRGILPDRNIACWEREILLGEEGPEKGHCWNYYFSHGDWFVDFSTFYSTLTKVELSAAVVVNAEYDKNVEMILWSYAAVKAWCNGQEAGGIDKPVYKPIQRKVLTLNLQSGRNLIYLKMQNLGVRDTRNIFGLQLVGNLEGLMLELPDMGHVCPYTERAEFLTGIRKQGQKLLFDRPAPEGTVVSFVKKEQLFAGNDKERMDVRVDGKNEIPLEKTLPHMVVTCEVEESASCRREIQRERKMCRHFEILEGVTPLYCAPSDNLSAHQCTVYEKIAEQNGSVRDGRLFGMLPILARRILGQEGAGDGELIRECLKPVDERYDCADFTVAALLRYLEVGPVNAALEKEIKRTLLGFRYWMDQEGSDGMCFWSENHAILYYSCMMLAGNRYPNEVFTASGMKGRELCQKGSELTKQWLDCICREGFEEFLSSGYMCVTFAALLNVIDYGNSALHSQAVEAADRLLWMLAVHTFRGTVIAPMGRVYRGVLYPFKQPTQVLMNLFAPYTPSVEETEGWVIFYANTSYRPPKELQALMEKSQETEYVSGNALIRLKKEKDYCLTSVQSPREDNFPRWKNLTLEEGPDTRGHSYTRSLNERFHGTTCFEPGVYGYQQHMWYGALDNDTFVFTSHPGGTTDSSSMRPGYWYGNGVMPAIKQQKNKIGVIYQIPEEYPVHFTHLFFPKPRFDWVREEGNWLFAGKGTGFLAVWCSGRMVDFDDQLFDCEKRVYEDNTAYFCICESKANFADEEAFVKNCLESRPVYIRKEGVLLVGDMEMQFEKREDKTQYI